MGRDVHSSFVTSFFEYILGGCHIRQRSESESKSGQCQGPIEEPKGVVVIRRPYDGSQINPGVLNGGIQRFLEGFNLGVGLCSISLSTGELRRAS
jgi:hypothetical protein